jgi:transposase-like protein
MNIINYKLDTTNELLTSRIGLITPAHTIQVLDWHFRVHHGKNEFARGNSHINGIESFWGYAKIRLVKFKGMNKDNNPHTIKQ